MDEILYRYRGWLIGLIALIAFLLGGASWHCLGIDAPALSQGRGLTSAAFYP